MTVKASVVIPTYNRWGQLRRVLDGYAAQTDVAGRVEVLVCDDASTDETPERVREFAASAPYPVRYLRQGHKGAAAARNLGIGAAAAPLVVFTDDDCVPHPDLLARHLARAGPGVATIGRVAWHPDVPLTPFREFVAGYKFNYAQIGDPQDAPFRCFFTANASAWRADLLAVGGFDEEFKVAYEDIELGYRLHRAGVRLVYDAAATIYHLHAMELGATLRRQVGDGREAARAVAKHPELAVEAGIPGLRDPGLARRFYQAAMDYYFVAGLQGGLAGHFGEAWPEELEDVLRRYPGYAAKVEQQFFGAERYARDLERRVAELGGEHERLAAANRALDTALRAANPLKNRLRGALRGVRRGARRAARGVEGR